MGTYNRLHTSLICPRCGATSDTIVDCHFGYTAIMEDLQIGSRYPSDPFSPSQEEGSADGEGYMVCPRCHKDAFLRVLVRDGIIRGVEPDTEQQGYIPDEAS